MTSESGHRRSNSRYTADDDHVFLSRSSLYDIQKGFDSEEGLEVTVYRIRSFALPPHTDIIKLLTDIESLSKKVSSNPDCSITSLPSILAWWTDPDADIITVITNYLPNSAHNFMDRTGMALRSHVAIRWCGQIAAAVSCLHANNMHCPSLSTETVLIDGGVSAAQLALSSLLPPQSYSESPFIAPEHRSGGNSASGDVWSFGMTALSLLAPESSSPYENCPLVIAAQRSLLGPPPELESLSLSYQSLIRACLSNSAVSRPTSDVIMKNPLFSVQNSSSAKPSTGILSSPSLKRVPSHPTPLSVVPPTPPPIKMWAGSPRGNLVTLHMLVGSKEKSFPVNLESDSFHGIASELSSLSLADQVPVSVLEAEVGKALGSLISSRVDIDQFRYQQQTLSFPLIEETVTALEPSTPASTDSDMPLIDFDEM
eukprot:gnl/Dysnectes_brevis/3569_a4537_842.p1 GENE.gnl/Dysnectes_brevis/3569_a4537_842~~gnl/Dysnectes_brevis/3569_a4537_842.p1  ORF type:complete len:427 (-),score=97.54 gnl/Dysnectes_brevis/3569_a4537_842:96-1376(-)